jgi:hypothetical protein
MLPADRLLPGDKVRARDGDFIGLYGTVMSADGAETDEVAKSPQQPQDCVWVMLSLYGLLHPVRVPVCHLERI